MQFTEEVTNSVILTLTYKDGFIPWLGHILIMNSHKVQWPSGPLKNIAQKWPQFGYSKSLS